MLANKTRDTSPELIIRRALHARGYRYRVAVPPIPGLRRTADILFTRPKVAIFIDGCFWHACPVHYQEPKSHVEYWRPKIEQNQIRDLDTSERLRAAGWIVLRFWAHQPPGEIVETILQVLPTHGQI